MTDPFDEIRKDNQRKKDELAKQRQTEEKLEQQRKIQLAIFANELSKHTPKIIEILEEFESALSGISKPRDKSIFFRNSGLSAITHINIWGGNDAGGIFFRIDSDNKGDIKGYYLGTYDDIQLDYSEKRVYRKEIALSPKASEDTIKKTLVKLYKKNG